MSHTPAPWWVDVHKNVMASGGMVAFPCISAGFDQDANARLIASAPAMLEALETAATVMKLQRDVIERGQHAAAWNPAIESVCAAIAAAKGEA